MVNEVPAWSIRSVVVSVRDLDRSSTFYQGIMNVREVFRENQIAVLSGDSDSTFTVYLREAQRNAVHPGQTLGFRAVSFDVQSIAELDRVEGLLRDLDAFRAREFIDDAHTVEMVQGQDPDRLPLVFVFNETSLPLADYRRALARLYAIDL